MTYVTDQTSAELCAHMRKLKAMPGWHEPLADRLWKEVQDLTLERDALRAALQDKAVEVREIGGVEVATAAYEIASALYFADNSDYVPAMRTALRCLAPDVEAGIAAGGPEASGWWHTASDRLAEARDGNKAQPAPVAPEMSSIAIRKLGGLQDRGWQINGYAIRRGNERGFVDAIGFVGWWRSEIAPVVPDDVARDAERWRKFSGLDYKVRREWASNLSLVPVLTEWVDSLPSPLAASQQKGGSVG